MLANGGFEALNAAGGAENWAIRNWGREDGHTTMRIAPGGRFGQRCLQLESNTYPVFFACFSHPVSLGAPAPDELLLSLFYRTVGSPQADLSVATFDEDFTAKEWETPVLTTEALPLESSTPWRSVTWRVQMLPAAHQAVVMVRIHGSGSVFVDGVSLKAYPAEVDCQVQTPGLLVSAAGARECRLQLTNRTEGPLPVTVQLEAATPKGPRAAATAKVALAPGKPEALCLKYAYPPQATPTVTLTVTGPQPEQICDYQVHLAAGFLDGYTVRPAFRGTLLPSLGASDVCVRGSVNAAPELQKGLKLQARLVGLGLTSEEFAPDTEGRWECTLPGATLLAGQYAVEVTASQGGRPVGRLDVPLVKPEGSTAEAGYDERLRYWLNGKPRLPFGLYYASEKEDFAAAAEAGFNSVLLPSRTASMASLEAMAKLGLWVVVGSGNMEQSFWENISKKYGENQTLGAWYMLQRPAAQIPPVHPALMADLYARLGKLDPRHPICLASDSLSRLEPYAPWCDVLMPWTRPEPVGDLRAVDLLVRRSVEVAGGRKPVWPIIQLTGDAWSQDLRLDPAGNGRPPTPEEYRCMVYLSLARGATGVFSYAYRLPQGRQQREYFVKRDAPALWEMARRLGRELAALTPVLLEGEPVAVSCGNPDIPLRGLKYQGVFYVLAANPTDAPVPIAFKVPGMAGSDLEVAFDSRKLCGPAAGDFADRLEKHAVRVYMGR